MSIGDVLCLFNFIRVNHETSVCVLKFLDETASVCVSQFLEPEEGGGDGVTFGVFKGRLITALKKSV